MLKKCNSLLFIILFSLQFVLFTACRINLPYHAFHYNPASESADQNYIVKKDGTKIYGNKVDYRYGIIGKSYVKIDDKSFNFFEIAAYESNGIYYYRDGTDFLKRIVAGKLNVYVKFLQVTRTTTYQGSGASVSREYEAAEHYAQREDFGPLIKLKNMKDIKKLVIECPTAVSMVNMSMVKVGREVKKDPKYLNKVFEIYNNNCKEPYYEK